MQKLHRPEGSPPEASRNKFIGREGFAERRYASLKGQLSCVEHQLAKARSKKERLEEFSDCSEVVEQHDGYGDWVKYQSAIHTKKACMSDLRSEAFGAAMGIYAKTMLAYSIGTAVALVPLAMVARDAMTEGFLAVAGGALAFVSLLKTRDKIRGGSPDFIEAVSSRIDEQISDLEAERKRLTKKIFGMDSGQEK